MSDQETLEDLKKTRIGAIKYNNNNELMKVIDYCNVKKVLVEFQDEYKGTKYVAWTDFEKGSVRNPSYKNKYIGMTNKTNEGYIIKIIQYNNYHNIIVEFQDEYQKTVCTTMKEFKKGSVRNPKTYENRINSVLINKQGCLMKVVQYNNSHNIVIEFQDKYKCRINSRWDHFVDGTIENPYYPTVCGVGMIGNKYHIRSGEITCKEYNTWRNMLIRCYNEEFKKKEPTYQNVTCCEEWLLYENFYDWLHSQENFEKWCNIENSAIDKDILIKGNKIYSPSTCCLVPKYINNLFIKADRARGIYPIGVCEHTQKYKGKNGIHIYDGVYNVSLSNKYLGRYYSLEEAFNIYKIEKERYIKQIAQEEFKKGNITKCCYNAMKSYKVEITD